MKDQNLKEIELDAQGKKFNPLMNSQHVNIAMNTDYNENNKEWKFRVSDDKNDDLFWVFEDSESDSGTKYFKLKDRFDNLVLHSAYKTGLGVVGIFNPMDDFLGECSLTVTFRCLSVKVKYWLKDDEGQLILTMSRILLTSTGSKSRFTLSIKSNGQKLGEIQMGTLKTCCHIKFDSNMSTQEERKLIIGLWATFMDYNVHENSNFLEDS